MLNEPLSNLLSKLDSIESLLKVADDATFQRNYDLANTIADASITLLSANFEAFTKEIGKEFILEVNRRVTHFNLLPKHIQEAHLRYTAEYIVKKRPPISESDLEDIARRYGSPFTIGAQYELIPESFGDCMANPSCDVVRQVFKKMGVDLRNDVLSKNGDIRVQTLEKWLKSFIDLRNSIAHGDLGRMPTPINTVRENIDNFRSISQYLTDRVDEIIGGL